MRRDAHFKRLNRAMVGAGEPTAAIFDAPVGTGRTIVELRRARPHATRIETVRGAARGFWFDVK